MTFTKILKRSKLIKIFSSKKKNNSKKKFFWIFSKHSRKIYKISSQIIIKVTYNFLLLKGISLSILNTWYILLKNLLKGFVKYFFLKLELRGRGFRLEKVRTEVFFKIGYSHLVPLHIPLSFRFLCLKKSLLYLEAEDLNYLTEFGARLKFYKPLDTYKGKGICFLQEVKQLKVGKISQK